MPADAWGANRRRAGEDSTVLPLPPLGSGSSGPSSNGALRGVSSAISYAHEGSAQAVAEVLSGAARQRWLAHFMRSLLLFIPKSAHGLVPARPPLGAAARGLQDLPSALPPGLGPLLDASEELLAHLNFAREHRRRLISANPLEPLHKEIKAAQLRRRHLPHPRIAHVDGRDAGVGARPDGRSPTAATSARDRWRGSTWWREGETRRSCSMRSH